MIADIMYKNDVSFVWQSGKEVNFLTYYKKLRELPKLDAYIRIERRYMTYREAARFFSMEYYQLVRLAKEANACWKIRKTVIVDLDKLEVHLETYKHGGI